MVRGTPAPAEAPAIGMCPIAYGSLSTPPVDDPSSAPFERKHTTNKEEYQKRFGKNALAGTLNSLFVAQVMEVNLNSRPSPSAIELFNNAGLEPATTFSMKVMVQAFSDWIVIKSTAIPAETAFTLSLLPTAWPRTADQAVPNVGDSIYVRLVTIDSFSMFWYESKISGEVPGSQALGIKVEDVFGPCVGTLDVGSILSPVMGTPILATCGAALVPTLAPPPPPAPTPKILAEVTVPKGILTLPEQSVEKDVVQVISSTEIGKARAEGKAAFLAGEPDTSGDYISELQKVWLEGWGFGYTEAYEKGQANGVAAYQAALAEPLLFSSGKDWQADPEYANPYAVKEGEQTTAVMTAWQEGWQEGWNTEDALVSSA